MLDRDTLRIAFIAVAAVMIAKLLLPKVPGVNALAAYL